MPPATNSVAPAARPKKNRLLPVFGALVMLALGLLLASWQLGRAHQKEALQARIEQSRREPAVELDGEPVDPAAVEYRRVVAHGTWLPERSILLDNQIRQGVPGYHVLTPLRLEKSGTHVLVDRGWVAAPRLRSEWPKFDTPREEVEVLGYIRQPRRSFLLSKEIAEGRVWEVVDLERYRQWSGLALHPFLLQQIGSGGGQLMRDDGDTRLASGKHYGFAAMWIALGIAGAVMVLAASRTKEAQ